MKQISLIALIALLEGAEALKITRDPLLTWAPTKKKDAFKMGYGVPSFGRDHDDVNDTLQDMALAEKNLSHEWTGAVGFYKDNGWKNTGAALPKDPKRDYFVPHFGRDADITSSLAEVAKAEAKFGEWIVPKDRSQSIKRDYIVPHFGRDQDVKETLLSVADAEAKFGPWNLTLGKKKKSGPADPPNFGLDHEINDSMANLKDMEETYGTWTLPPEDIQLSAEIRRDPLLSWKPKKHKSYDMNYFVPHFGRDADIVESQSNEKATEGLMEHEWVPTKDEDGEWELPSPQIEFKLA